MLEYLQGFPGVDKGTLVRFVEPCPDVYKCGLCRSVTFSLYQGPCPHCFCSDCVIFLNKCPYDGITIDCDQVDESGKISKCALLNLKVYCTYIDNGCPEITTLKNIAVHLRSCPFAGRTEEDEAVSVSRNLERKECSLTTSPIASDSTDNYKNEHESKTETEAKDNTEHLKEVHRLEEKVDILCKEIDVLRGEMKVISDTLLDHHHFGKGLEAKMDRLTQDTKKCRQDDKNETLSPPTAENQVTTCFFFVLFLYLLYRTLL